METAMEEQEMVERVGGLELVGMTREEFDDFCFTNCPANVSMRAFHMKVIHEAVRVHQNSIDFIRRTRPEFRPDPEHRPVLDAVVLCSFIYRPGWERVHRMTTLERLRRLAEIEGGRFAECARRDMERLARKKG